MTYRTIAVLYLATALGIPVVAALLAGHDALYHVRRAMDVLMRAAEIGMEMRR